MWYNKESIPSLPQVSGTELPGWQDCLCYVNEVTQGWTQDNFRLELVSLERLTMGLEGWNSEADNWGDKAGLETEFNHMANESTNCGYIMKSQ